MNDIRDLTQSDSRIEGLSYITSFSYFIGLLEQTGLVAECEKGKNNNSKYWKICNDKTNPINEIINEVENDA